MIFDILLNAIPMIYSSFGSNQVKGSKDIDRTTLGLYTDLFQGGIKLYLFQDLIDFKHRFQLPIV